MLQPSREGAKNAGRTCTRSLVCKPCKKEPAPARKVAGMEEDHPMRKVFSVLDDEQRQALIEVVDLSTAIASAGLIVSMLKLFVDLIA